MSEVRQPSRLGIDFRSAWFTGHLHYDIEPAADGCVLHHRETLRPRLLLRRLGPFVERRLRPRLTHRLADLKAVVEEEP